MPRKMFKVMYLFLILNLGFISLCFGEEDELLSVVVIYRHGDRTPVDPYPTDPYKNSSLWPVGFGQLTSLGKKQHYELGQWLRNRYNNFLPQIYSENDIYIRSSDVDRTLMSAEANLAGLYPPNEKQMFDAKLPWQPIPIHTEKETKDAILAMKEPCPQYGVLETQLNKGEFIQGLQRKYHDLYAYLTKNAGKTISDIVSVEFLYTDLFIEAQNNLTLPAWAQQVFPEKLYYLSTLSFALPCFTPEMARLKVGPLVSKITQHFSNISNPNLAHDYGNVWARKFIMLSGHDITIANVLQSFGLFDLHCPPYTSMILMELRRNKETGPYVNLFYKNSTIPLKLTLKNCTFNCPLEDFIRILKPVTLSYKDWQVECQLKSIFTVLNALVFFASFSATLMVFKLISLCKGKKKSEQSPSLYTRIPDEEEA